MINKIIQGDCIEEMKKLEENSVDAIVTDPPYGLAFMGKEWDTFSEYKKEKQTPRSEFKSIGRVRYYRKDGKPVYWNKPTYVPKEFKFVGKNQSKKNKLMENFFFYWAIECLRVLKPGGFLLSFGGTRTFHRLVCGIEDAGFEIRDTISWIYASGFPKSLSVHKQIQKFYKGGNTSIEHNGKQETKYDLRQMSETNLSETINSQDKQGEVLQSELSEQNTHQTMQGEEPKERTQGSEESSMEGGSDLLQDTRKLQRCEICKMPKEISCYVQKGWLCNGTQINNGKEIKEGFKENRSDTSQRSQSRKQQDKKSYAICEQCQTQILGRHEGIGTALKPAQELICVARKPLSEKNVALNVLKWGTGGLNIDDCRIVHNEELSKKGDEHKLDTQKQGWGFKSVDRGNEGRFPANIILEKSYQQIYTLKESFINIIPLLNRYYGNEYMFKLQEEISNLQVSDEGQSWKVLQQEVLSSLDEGKEYGEEPSNVGKETQQEIKRINEEEQQSNEREGISKVERDLDEQRVQVCKNRNVTKRTPEDSNENVRKEKRGNSRTQDGNGNKSQQTIKEIGDSPSQEWNKERQQDREFGNDGQFNPQERAQRDFKRIKEITKGQRGFIVCDCDLPKEWKGYFEPTTIEIDYPFSSGKMLDEQAPLTGAFAPVKSGQKEWGGEIYHKFATSGDDGKTFYGKGLQGASRFFYCAKSSKAERNNFGEILFELKKDTPKEIKVEIEKYLNTD